MVMVDVVMTPTTAKILKNEDHPGKLLTDLDGLHHALIYTLVTKGVTNIKVLDTYSYITTDTNTANTATHIVNLQ